MQDKGRMMGTGARGRIHAFLSVMLTAAMTLNMPLSVLGAEGMEPFALAGDSRTASGNDAVKRGGTAGTGSGSDRGDPDLDEGWMTAKNAEYRQGARQDVDIYVVAEDNDVAPGNMSTMRLYLKNNTGSVVTDGTLRFTGTRIKKEDGAFTDISGTGTPAMDTSADGRDGGEGMDAAGGLGRRDGQDTYDGQSRDNGLDEESQDELDALEAESFAREFGKDGDGEGLTELTGLYLEPGQLHEIEFAFYTDDSASAGKAYVDFKFQGEGGDGKVQSEEKFYYSIGLPSVDIELLDGQALATGVEHELSIWMNAPSWTDYEVEEVQIPLKKEEATTAAEAEAGTATGTVTEAGTEESGTETTEAGGSQAAGDRTGATGTKAESGISGTEIESGVSGAKAESRASGTGTESGTDKGQAGPAGTDEADTDAVKESGAQEETPAAVIIEDDPVPAIVRGDGDLGSSPLDAAIVRASLTGTADTADTVITETEAPAKESGPEESVLASLPSETEETETTAAVGETTPEETTPEGTTPEESVLTSGPSETEASAPEGETTTEAGNMPEGSTTAGEPAQESLEAPTAETVLPQALVIKESKVSYTVEIFGTEFKKFRPKKTTEAEDIGWIDCLYELAEDARPGVYYGKVTAKGTWQKKSFTTSQGFLFEITGEGTVTLKSKLDGMSVEVSGPVSSFPEADELELLVETLPQEEQGAVEEAMEGEGTLYTTFSLSLLADGETADTEGPVTVRIIDPTIKESTAPVVAAQEIQAAAAAPTDDQAAGTQGGTEPQAGTESQAGAEAQTGSGQAAAQTDIRKGPGTSGRMSSRALLAADGSLLVAEEEKEEVQEEIIADSKAAELTLMKVDTRSAQAQDLEAVITENGALQIQTSEVMANYAVARGGEGSDETGDPGQEEQPSPAIADFIDQVDRIKKNYQEKPQEVSREEFMEALDVASNWAETNGSSIAEADKDAFDKAYGELTTIKTEIEDGRNNFKGCYDEICGSIETGEWTADCWTQRTEEIQVALALLDTLNDERYVLSTEEYQGYRSGLLDEQAKADCREFDRLFGKEPAGSFADRASASDAVKQGISFRQNYLDRWKMEDEDVSAETQKSVQTTWDAFLKRRADLFLAWEKELAQAVKEGEYTGYEGYYKFRSAMKDHLKLLTTRAGTSEEERDLAAYMEELAAADKDKAAEVDAARSRLDDLCGQLSMMVTPEAREAFERFAEGYQKLLEDYEAFYDQENVGSPSDAAKNWSWETINGAKGIRERIEELLKLADSLPTELYKKVKTKIDIAEQILSREAVREFERILGGLQALAEDTTMEASEKKKAIEELDAAANRLFDYVDKDTAEWLRERLELLKAMAAGKIPEEVKAFEDVAAEFIKKLERLKSEDQEPLNSEFLDEGKKLLAYKLLCAYNTVWGYHGKLNDAQQQLVQDTVDALWSAWDGLDEKYQNAIGAMEETGLYDFLEQVYALQKYWETDKESKEKGFFWNIEMSYDDLQEMYGELEKLWELALNETALSKSEFIDAKVVLDGIDKWIKEKAESLSITQEDIPTAGDHVIGREAWSSDTSIQGKTIELSEEFVQLIHTMGGSSARLNGDMVTEEPDWGVRAILADVEGIRDILARKDELQIKREETQKLHPDLTDDVLDEWLPKKEQVKELFSKEEEECNEEEKTLREQLNGIMDFIYLEDEVEQLNTEIGACIERIDSAVKSTEYDNWHGLAGGSVKTVTAWEDKAVQDPMQFELPSMSSRALGMDLNQLIEARQLEGDLKKTLDDAVETVRGARTELDIRMFVAERISRTMQNWKENGDDITIRQGYRTDQTQEYPVIEKTDKDGKTVDAIPPSLENAKALSINIQVFEGVLSEEHDILQKMLETTTEGVNAGGEEVTLSEVRCQLKALSETLTFLAKYVSYGGWHGLCGPKGSTIHVPMGWPQYKDNHQCDHVNVEIGDMTADGLSLTNVIADGGIDESMIEAIRSAINKISIQRSVFGAWQNTCSHVIQLCEIKMEGIPLIGNKFDRTVDGHHIPVKLTGPFDRVYGDMRSRIYELEIQRSVSSEQIDIDAINTELERLPDGMDVLIDLIRTDMVVAPYVKLTGEEYKDWKDSVRIEKNEMEYRYKLEYEALASNTTEVCLVDHIEEGDDSYYAGTVKGVDLTDAENNGIQVKVYVRSSKSTEPTSGELPEGLHQEVAAGRGGWQLIDPDRFRDWPYVTSIAFYFVDRNGGAYTFERINDHRPEVSVEILMESVYGGKPGSEKKDMSANGYELDNTCSVYQKVGSETDLTMTRGGWTQVFIDYKTEGLPIPIRLPETGGPGLVQFNRFGWLLLLLALLMAGTEVRYFGIQRRRVEEEEGLEEAKRAGTGRYHGM